MVSLALKLNAEYQEPIIRTLQLLISQRALVHLFVWILSHHGIPEVSSGQPWYTAGAASDPLCPLLPSPAIQLEDVVQCTVGVHVEWLLR